MRAGMGPSTRASMRAGMGPSTGASMRAPMGPSTRVPGGMVAQLAARSVRTARTPVLAVRCPASWCRRRRRRESAARGPFVCRREERAPTTPIAARTGAKATCASACPRVLVRLPGSSAAVRANAAARFVPPLTPGGRAVRSARPVVRAAKPAVTNKTVARAFALPIPAVSRSASTPMRRRWRRVSTTARLHRAAQKPNDAFCPGSR